MRGSVLLAHFDGFICLILLVEFQWSHDCMWLEVAMTTHALLIFRFMFPFQHVEIERIPFVSTITREHLSTYTQRPSMSQGMCVHTAHFWWRLYFLSSTTTVTKKSSQTSAYCCFCTSWVNCVCCAGRELRPRRENVRKSIKINAELMTWSSLKHTHT